LKHPYGVLQMLTGEVGSLRPKLMLARLSAVGGQVDVLVTIANDLIDPQRTQVLRG
jgi:hypothetical protein